MNIIRFSAKESPLINKVINKELIRLESQLKLDKHSEKGETVLSAALLLPAVLLTILFIVSVGVTIYSENIVHNEIQRAMSMAEGTPDIWVKNPYDDPQGRAKYATGLNNLSAQFSQQHAPIKINYSKVRNQYTGQTEHTMALLPPGFCAMFEDGNVIDCNDSNICPEPSNLAALLLSSNLQVFDFCKKYGEQEINIQVQRSSPEIEQILSTFFSNPQMYSYGACGSGTSNLNKTCSPRGGREFLDIVNDYPTKAVAKFKVDLPLLRNRSITITKTGKPRLVVSGKGCIYDFSWRPGDWGLCQGACDNQTGMQYRKLFCDRLAGCDGQPQVQVSSIYCDNSNKPADSQQCSGNIVYDGVWVPTAWGACAGLCGQGTQSRSVSCNGQCCNQATKPPLSRSCTPPTTIYDGSWVSGDWSACSGACPTGSQTRTVSCNGLCCDPNTKPVDTQSCPMTGCTDYECRHYLNCKPWQKGEVKNCAQKHVSNGYTWWSWTNPSNCSPACSSDCQDDPQYECVYILGNERYTQYTGGNTGYAEIATSLPQCLQNEFINNKRCQFVQYPDKMEYCKYDIPNRTCVWTVDEGVSFVGYYGGGTGQAGRYWVDSCYTNSNVMNDAAKRRCFVTCRANTGFNCYTDSQGGYDVCGWGCSSSNPYCDYDLYKAQLGPSDKCIRDTCGMRRYDLQALYAFVGLPVPYGTPAECLDGMIDWSEFQYRGRWNDPCKGEWYLDKNCKVVPAGPRVCGVVDLQSTPISLVWGKGEETLTVAKFALDPSVDGQWSVWRASSQMPLLVYDPKHTGKVTSAMQLFGSFALGGKDAQLLKISGDLSQVKPSSKWNNGYEALALFDRNRDGVIKDSELHDIALWFDANQDATSQQGEVIPASSVGLTALYYKEMKVGDHEFRIELGYEREAEGKKESGQSIDWLGAVYKTKFDATMALFVADSKKTTLNSIQGNEAPKVEYSGPLTPMLKGVKSKKQYEDFNSLPDVSGYWQWAIIEEGNAPSAPGFFVLNDDGVKIDGWSVLNAKSGNVATGRQGESVFAVPLWGQKGLDQKGGQELTLSIRQDTGETTSVVSVSPSGQSMYGKSTQKVKSDKGTVTVEYNWYAHRIKEKARS